jgi:transposase InsO family protein
VRYRKKRKDDTAERELLRALAAERRRFGYRRLREMAKRKGRRMNLKKVYRLYREEGLAVRQRRGRKRAIGARASLHQAQRPNQIWVLDFMSDVLETGRRFRVFNVEDQLTREGLAADTVRPHSILGYLTPEEFAASWRAAPDKQQQPDAAPRPATGRAAAVLGASASRPVAGTPTAGQTENRLNYD